MSLSRAFTTTRKMRMSNDGSHEPRVLQRSSTTKTPQNVRAKISAPVQLVHTTNMLSYNAPDLPRANRSNSTDGSDVMSEETPPTSPDVSPAEASPTPGQNHLSSYFMAPTKVAAFKEADPPAIPKRSPSHTKKNSYQAIARQRSVSQMSRDSERTVASKPSMTFSRSSSTSTRASSASNVSTPQPIKESRPPVPSTPPAATVPSQQRARGDSHPFGPELAQVTELAEEYAAKSTLHVIDEDTQYLDSRGLVRLSPEDYMNDIQELYHSFFPAPKEQPISAGPMWI